MQIRNSASRINKSGRPIGDLGALLSVALLILAVGRPVPTWSQTETDEAIPAYAGRIAIYEPGSAPPHVVLGVVHSFRRGNQRTHSLYAELAVKTREYGGDIIVGAVSGRDDPLGEGYTRWVLGIAARSVELEPANETLQVCDNCLVGWRFDASQSGITDTTQLAQLESMSFSIARLKLAKRGHYLTERDPASPGVAGHLPMDQQPSPLLEVRVSRTPVDKSHDLLSFAAHMPWAETGSTIWEYAHGLQIPRPMKVDFLGKDRSLTRNALCGVYSRLPSQYEDSDEDGIPNARDREPNTPPGYQVDCHGRTLDSDGDGVANTIDDQPFTIAKYRRSVGPNGVPLVNYDADYDGTPDAQDECADTDVRCAVDERGCEIQESEIVKTLVNREVLRERRILFQSGEAELLPVSKARLDSLGEALSGLPELRFNIDGHCDDRGTKEFNQLLSERRADAVVKYLVQNFSELAQEQFRARGYGKSVPIAEGTDDFTRQQNRRVEITVQNPEDAVRHVEETRCRLRDEAIDGYQFDSQADDE